MSTSAIAPSTAARFDPRQQRRRLLAWLALILSLAFAAASGSAYWVASREVRQSIVERELPLTGESIYSEIQRDILRPVFVSAQMAENTWLRDWVEAGEQDVAPLLRYLREIKSKNNAVSSFYVSALTSNYYHPSGAERRVKESEPRDAWFYRVLKMKDDYEISADPDAMNKGLFTLFINYKMFGADGKLLGVTGVGLSSENLVQLVKDYEQRFVRRIILIGEHGEVVLTSDTTTTLPGKTRVTPKLTELPGLSQVAPQIVNQSVTQTKLSYQTATGSTTFVNSRFIPELRWYLIVEQDEARALEPVRRVFAWSVFIGLAAMALTISVVNSVVGRFQRRLEVMATIDELSQLPNRRSGEGALDLALQKAQTTSQPLGLLVMDLDNFKRVNDTLGHAAGDRVIAQVAQLAQQCIRPSDTVARWGGEEFVVLLHNADAALTAKIAERLRDAVAHAPMSIDGQTLNVTVSVGSAQWNPGETGTSFLSRADAALLHAKKRGRNRVETALA